MPLDFAHVETFLSRCRLRDRDSNARVYFNFKYNQSKLHRAAAEMQDSGRPIRLLVDKARRVTCSSWTEGLLFCHNLAFPGSHSLVVAHEFKTSKELFSIPKGFAQDLPFLNLRMVEREITFPFANGDSKMQILTAGKDTSGRGFTLSALHASEAAHYISPDAFISLLPALSNHRDTIGVIESTPNGKEGDGEVFYNMYQDAVEGKSEWRAVFLSWTDDPACVAPEEFAKGAPADSEERDLLAKGYSLAQLAWRRLKIASPECSGSVEIFHQEYPTNAEESFIASGMPAFSEEERRWARKNVRPPLRIGFLDRSLDGAFLFREHHKGDLAVYEEPIPGHYYYAGMDAARGIEGRDFSAMVGFDGTTGHQAFRYAGYSVPEIFAAHGNSLGRRYNKAMLNPELTGGYGYTVLSALRDYFLYPNLYYWKGKDDKAIGGAVRRTFGFETTSHMRNVLFEQFRVGLREAAGTDGDYGITVYDDVLVSQIDLSTRKDVRIDVEKGHDDVLFGAMLGNIAMRHWAPPRSPNRSRSDEGEEDAVVRRSIGARGDTILDDASQSLARHYAKVQAQIKKGGSQREAADGEV